MQSSTRACGGSSPAVMDAALTSVACAMALMNVAITQMRLIARVKEVSSTLLVPFMLHMNEAVPMATCAQQMDMS